MALLKSCCFMSVEKGSYLSAIFTLIFYGIIFITGLFHLQNVYGNPKMFILSLIFISLSGFSVITSIILFMGLSRKKRLLLIPWLIVTSGLTIVDVGLTVVILWEASLDPFFLTILFIDISICTANIFSFLCVASYYQLNAAMDVNERTGQANQPLGHQLTRTVSEVGSETGSSSIAFHSKDCLRVTPKSGLISTSSANNSNLSACEGSTEVTYLSQEHSAQRDSDQTDCKLRADEGHVSTRSPGESGPQVREDVLETEKQKRRQKGSFCQFPGRGAQS